MKTKTAICKQCRERFDQEKMIVVPVGKFCTYDHAFMWQRDKQDKARAKQIKKASIAIRNEKKEHRAAKKKFKDNDRPHQLKLAQKAFNAFIRERDKEESCISCGVKKALSFHCGHYRSVGSAPHLRFNTKNAHLQCSKCNIHLSSNAIKYRIGLVRKIGIESVMKLESDNRIKKYQLVDIIRIKSIFLAKTKRLNHGKEKNTCKNR